MTRTHSTMKATHVVSIILIAALAAAIVIIVSPGAKDLDVPNGNEAGTIEVVVMIGPLCPVERIDQPCVASQAVFNERPVNILDSKGNTVARGAALAPEGVFRVELPAGDYVASVEGASQFEYADPQAVKVEESKTTRVTFSLDTGIR